MTATHVVEHRRVLGGDWIKVQTVDADTFEHVAEFVVFANDASGVGDWRIRPIGDAPAARIAEAREIPKPSIRERVRFWWVMRFSKRGRA